MDKGWVDELPEPKTAEETYVAKDGEDFAAYITARIPSLSNGRDVRTIKMAFEAGMCSGIQQAREILSETVAVALGDK